MTYIPSQNFPKDYELPSEWAARMEREAITRCDWQAASDYSEIHNMWLRREEEIRNVSK